jgi:large subunit ribosomal protein L28
MDKIGDTFKRAQRGLFAGKKRLTGYSVSASKRHTKRVWLPNVQRTRLFSAILDKPVTISVTTTALRTIDRFGGLDEYILRSQPGQLKSAFGETLRRQLKKHAESAEKYKERVAARSGASGASSPQLR